MLSYLKKISGSVTCLLITWNLLEYFWRDSQITVLSGDKETNPASKHFLLSQGFTIWHWNLNSLSLQMYKKVSLLSEIPG